MAPVLPSRSSDRFVEIAELVRARLADVLALPQEEILDDCSFDDLGLDSILRMELVRVLGELLDLRLDAAELYDHDTVRLLANVLAETAGGDDVPSSEQPEFGQPESDRQGIAVDPRALVEMVDEALGRPLIVEKSFADNGLTSFDMLRVISHMEKRLGSLPKTLLFDCPTAPALADYLAAHNGGVLPSFAGVAGLTSDPVVDTRPVIHDDMIDGEPVVVVKRRLQERPDLAGLIADLHTRHAVESGLAGRDIAPLVFLGAKRKAYFNFSMREDNLFAWSYVGRDEDFADLVADWLGYAARRGLKANFLALLRLEEAGGVPLAATGFGALQRLERLETFSLAGGKMSRLRYMVKKFERLGPAETVEYLVGSDPLVDAAIATMVDRWGAGKQMTNPYVDVVREELRDGHLGSRHRTFLTYLNRELANVVIITDLPAVNGHLLDLEFYPPEMPLGGLEYAIVRIAEILAAEGCDTFSFGASFGVRIGESATSEPEVETGLEELRSVGIFDEGNFQFKNKFRPTNTPIYLCRPARGPRTSMADIILMIASPDLSLESRFEPSAPPEAGAASGQERQERERILAQYFFNPSAIPPTEVRYDLGSDSWWDIANTTTSRRMVELTDAATGGAGVGWLNRRHVITFDSLMAARAALCRCWQGLRRSVPAVGVGEVWRETLRTAGFDVLDMAAEDEVALSATANASFILVGLGRPMTMITLRRLSEMARAQRTRVVLDATRLVERAIAMAGDDPGMAGDDPAIAGGDPQDAERVRGTVADILGLVDVVVLGLAEEHGIVSGALIATDDTALADRVDEHLLRYGSGLSLVARQTLAGVVGDLEPAVTLVRRRVDAVTVLRQRLVEAGLPVAPSASAHDVELHLDRLGMFGAHESPRASALAWIFAGTGIRAGHVVDEDGRDRREARDRIRLGVPVGTSSAVIDEVASDLIGLVREPGEIPDLIVVRGADAHATVLERYHPAGGVPDDIRVELRDGYAPADDNWQVLREHQPAVRRDVLRLEDADVEVFSAGSGPCLLLQHPFNIGAGVFAAQFAALADRYRVICVHHPGVGGSRGSNDLSLDAIARVDRAAVAALDIDGPIHVLGSSFGGLTALAFALNHPEAVGSLILIGSPYTIDNRADQLNRLDAVAERDLTSAIEGSRSRRLRKEKDRHQQVILRSESMDPYTGLRYLDVFSARPTFLPRLHEVLVPTQIIHGRYDTVVPIKAAHLLHGAIPLARFEELPDAGHFPMVTCAEKVTIIIAEFLAEVAGGCPPAPAASDPGMVR